MIVFRATLDAMRSSRDEWKEIAARMDTRASVAEEQGKAWQALFNAERERCDRLTEKLLTLKQQGFTTATERQALPAPAQSAIDLAIEEKAGNNRALARYLSKQAAAMQQAKLSEDEIVAKLTKWRDPDADEAST
jgi:septal ring factor EnvC (AmiA/AmiB activator)